jgi:N-acetylglucosaminyldiphosphoundecaprenol N-acetyl-beta-D-mannosaminyltransferase
MQILGVRLTFDNYDKLIDKIWSSSIFTVGCANQHYLNIAYKDYLFKNELNELDLVHPDGVGVVIAAIILSNFSFFPTKITGSDLYLKLLKRADEERASIFLLGDIEAVLKKCCYEINSLFPNIKIVGIHNGYFDLENTNVTNIINDALPDILFVGLGAPRQERWISKWKNSIKVKKIIAVGGGFRVIGKDRTRGPKFMQNYGLEWFIRLLSNPLMYWRRYLIGIPLFLYRILKSKIRNRVWA